MKGRSGFPVFVKVVLTAFFAAGLAGALLHRLIIQALPDMASPWPIALIALFTSFVIAWPATVYIRRGAGAAAPSSVPQLHQSLSGSLKEETSGE